MFAALRFRAVLNELEELFHAFAGRRLKVEFHPYAEARIALDHDSVEDKTFDPNFAAREPKSNLHVDATFHRGDCFHVTTAHACVR